MTRTHSLTATVRQLTTVSTDRQAWYIVALFVAVQAGALGLAFLVGDSVASEGPPGGVDGPAAGAGWALAEVLFACILVASIYAVRRVPEWIRDPLKKSITLGLVFLAGAYFHAAGITMLALVLFLGWYLGIKAIDGLGVWWVANNVMGLGLAIGGAVVLGSALSEWALLTFLVGMTAYDHLFADRKGWMMAMAGAFVRFRLPVLFVKPGEYRFDWDGLLEDDGADLEDSQTAWGIGTADLMLPAAFTVAVVTAETVLLPAVAGAVLTAGVALAALRIRRKMLTAGSGAGLPPLTAGIAGAYALVLLPSVLYGVVVA